MRITLTFIISFVLLGYAWMLNNKIDALINIQQKKQPAPCSHGGYSYNTVITDNPDMLKYEDDFYKSDTVFFISSEYMINHYPFRYMKSVRDSIIFGSNDNVNWFQITPTK